ncbi:MAG TPA: ATPase domain-containing protein [Dehalococcoidia bacterium]|nr:ATPase domain-containing protein [Dehalococcoidia bacterium]
MARLPGIYSSCVPGLDEVLLGGFRHGRSVMIEGWTGTGKTVLGMSIIQGGIEGCADNGVIVTFEQLPESLYQDALSLGWDFRALERQDRLRVIFISPATLVQELSAQISKVSDLWPRWVPSGYSSTA